MHIAQMPFDCATNASQGQVMRTHQPDRATPHERPHNPLRANASIVRVCSLQQFIEQKQQRRIFPGEIKDLP